MNREHLIFTVHECCIHNAFSAPNADVISTCWRHGTLSALLALWEMNPLVIGGISIVVIPGPWCLKSPADRLFSVVYRVNTKETPKLPIAVPLTPTWATIAAESLRNNGAITA